MWGVRIHLLVEQDVLTLQRLNQRHGVLEVDIVVSRTVDQHQRLILEEVRLAGQIRVSAQRIYLLQKEEDEQYLKTV